MWGFLVICFGGAIVVLILGYLIDIIFFNSSSDNPWYLAISFLYSIASMISLAVLQGNIEPSNVPYKEIDITALKDGHGSEGTTFFLGSGSVEGVSYYYYMVDTQYGKSMRKVEAEDTYIEEGDYEPKIIKYKEDFGSDFLNWIFPNKPSMTVIQVPENTVTTEFEVDLE